MTLTPERHPVTRHQMWKNRCTELAAWVQAHGRPPRQTSGELAERGLYHWLAAARRQVRAGTRTTEEADRLEAAVAGLASQVTTADRIKMIAAFHKEHGRLPLSTAPKGSHERELADALIQGIRPRLARGAIRAEDLAALSRIPGAAAVRTVPDQDDTLAELTAYAEHQGHMPPKGGCGTPEENRLANWWRNNTRGTPESKTAKLRARHEALLELEAKYPSKAGTIFETSLRQAEAFVAATGHLPSTGSKASTEERKLAGWVARYLAAEPADLPEELRSRLRALATVPTRVEFEWDANLAAVAAYAAAHAGRLPSNWYEDPLFSWLTVQRRAYRGGKMSEARLQKLLTVPGVISERTLAAAAAAA